MTSLADAPPFSTSFDDHVEEPPAAPKPAAKPASKPAAKSAPAPAAPAGPSKTLVRKIVQTALDIESASDARREMLTTLLGLRKSADTVSIVIAIQSGNGAAVAPITSLLSVATQQDPMEAVVAAAEMAEDRDLAKAVWSLLTSLDAVSGALPPVAVKAGAAIAKAACALDQDKAAELGSVRDLLR